MKFAREFREALASEGFPARWVQQAVPYGALKKCLKKVRDPVQVPVRDEYEIWA
jgi:E3 ubiquitin-protein ligase BAH